MRSFCLNLVLACALVVAGCSGGGAGTPLDVSGGTGGGGPTTSLAQLRIWVTDAPFPFDYVESASVVIREVSVHDMDKDQWVVVFSGESEIDLVPLTNGVEMLLVEASPPVGTYDEARLIVDSGEVVLTADAVVESGDPVFTSAKGNLAFPSGAQTGIKVKIENDIVVTTRLSADLVLDFDLSRNFVFNGPVEHAPGVKRVLFTPVVRALNDSTAGSVAVTVLSDNVTPSDTGDDFALAGATVRLRDAGANIVATGSTNAEGRAVVSAAPGTYDVEIEAAGHESDTVADVVVVLANLNDLGDVTLVASGEIGGVVMSDGGTDGDTDDDVVVAGATVALRAAGAMGTPLATTTTDASGRWQFAGLDAGDYDIEVTATGFVTGSLTDVAAELTTPGYTILLEALPQDLTGTVTPADGVDVTTVTITAKNAAGVTVATTAPASDGSYSLTLATGAYTIEFDDGTTQLTRSVTMVGASPPPAAAELDVSF